MLIRPITGVAMLTIVFGVLRKLLMHHETDKHETWTDVDVTEDGVTQDDLEQALREETRRYEDDLRELART